MGSYEAFDKRTGGPSFCGSARGLRSVLASGLRWFQFGRVCWYTLGHS